MKHSQWMECKKSFFYTTEKDRLEYLYLQDYLLTS